MIVALKVLKNRPGGIDLDDMFNQEVAILSALKGHANVAQMLGFINDTQLVIVMVAYDGNLAGLIRDHEY